MATRKRASKSKKGSKPKKAPSRARKSSRKTSAKASIPNGPVPPYGDPIRKAIARGDVQEMRKLAVSTRQWLDEVNAALAELEASLEKT
ncbi:MAG TPA: DUF1843 domain-containing protein [Pyrinomonadaceae bacterium]|nr:DUF1843 domain-containing protein [Pyrinomonadaceae bacterium]